MTDLVKIAEQTAGELLFDDPTYKPNFPGFRFEVSYDDLKEGVLKAMRTALSQADGYVRVPESALKWLMGEGPDDRGIWFGDFHPEQPKGVFWWRTKFRELIAAAPSQPQEGV